MRARAETSSIDRWADVAVRVAAALPLLLLSALLAGLLLASPANAETSACAGKNLLAELAAEDPAALEEVRRKAGETPNGQGLLWRVTRDGLAPSYLFGTMHMSDPRVTELSDAARQAFDGAERIVIETTDILDQRAMAAAIYGQPELTMFTGSETLADHLSAADREIVEAALSARGVPFGSVKKMKPWMLISLVALPSCEVQRSSAGLPVLDVKLARQAQEDGKELLGLESAVEQLAAMASLPMELHARGLVETLSLGERLEDVMETMVALYVDGETGMFWPLIRAAVPENDASEGDYAAFDQAMVKARNGVMAERSEPILEKGGAFIAVGALHLPGAEGLVELLRAAGYEVEKVD